MIFVIMSSAGSWSLDLQLAWQTFVQPHLCKTECCTPQSACGKENGRSV